MEIFARPFDSAAPVPICVVCVPDPTVMFDVPWMNVLVPSLEISVPSSIAKVLPLRLATTPEMRSRPDPCTLLPASTSVAENETSVAAVEELVPDVVIGAAPLAQVLTPLTRVGVEPSAQEVVVVELLEVLLEPVPVFRLPYTTVMEPLPAAESSASPASPSEGVP